MPTSQAGKVSKRTGAAGFTLVELLVVVTIVAILALGAGLTGGGAFSRRAETPRSMGEVLRQDVATARDRALLGRMPVGFRPRVDGWAMVQSDGAGSWREVGQPVTAPRLTLIWEIEGARYLPPLAQPEPDYPPAVQLRTDGGGTAFSVVLAEPGSRLTCRSDGWRGLECE